MAAGLERQLRQRGNGTIGLDEQRDDLGFLALGNEAQGLSDDLSQRITEWAALPIVGKADSLNVAVAGGVLMYAWVAANT